MAKLVLIAGPSGSGKTTLANELLYCGYKKLITCTTRPIRPGEVPDVDYHFLTNDEFFKKKNSGYFLETAEYREWFYGTPSEIPDTDSCIVLTPRGVRNARKIYPESICVYLNADRRTCLMRMLKRGDNVDEAYRRNLTDVGQFDGFEDEADITLSSDENTLKKLIDFLNEQN